VDRVFDPAAGVEAVRSTFRRLAKQMHPDAGGDADAFRGLVADYDRALRTAERRARAARRRMATTAVADAAAHAARCTIRSWRAAGHAPFTYRAVARVDRPGAGPPADFEWWIDGRAAAANGDRLERHFTDPGQHYVHVRARWEDGVVAAADEIVSATAPTPPERRRRTWFGV
jgi:hypothetical protein